jgi:hypothetical protein
MSHPANRTTGRVAPSNTNGHCQFDFEFGVAANRASAPSGAINAKLPDRLQPQQLATLSRSVPTSGERIYEIKFDGYRILTHVDNGRAFTTHSCRSWRHVGRSASVAAPGRFNRSDVDFPHLHHRVESALGRRAIRIGDCVNEGAWRDLP